jgi:hypothetical protein
MSTTTNAVDAWKEVDDILNANDCVALEGRVPGSGKTHLVLEYIRRHNLTASSIIVAPWNTLVADIATKGFNSMTLHKLLGKGIDTDDTPDGSDNALQAREESKHAKKSYSLDGITFIHFEEIYLYNLTALGWIARFMKAHPEIKFTMAGDPGQLDPVGQILAVDTNKYYETIFAELYPTRIVLCQSKRIADLSERSKMVALCDMLADTTTHPGEILSGFRQVKFTDLTADDFKYQHISAINATRDDVNSKAHNILGKPLYEVGQVLL